MEISEEEYKELKKKIKSLEDDLEEMQDDLDEQKKKVKKAEAEKSDIFDELSREKKSSGEAKESLSSANEQVKLTQESLDFVTEILTAKMVSEETYIDKIKKIEQLKTYISDDFASFIKEYVNGIHGTPIWEQFLGKSVLDKWEEISRKHWIQGKVKVAFVGEFSAGKTSIVNRLLSQDDPKVQKLPVSTKATTAIPTYISGGPATTYCFYSPDNKLKTITKETFEKVTKDVLDNVKGVNELIQYFVMQYKNPNLDGMSILDTPGFSSNDNEDKIRTLGVINECDALFWVFDVNSGTVNRSSLELIGKNLKKPLYVVINKVDTKSPSEVDNVEKLVKDTFKKANVKAEGFVRFSGKAPLDELMGIIKSIPKDNSSEMYLKNLTEVFIPTISNEFAKDEKGKAQNDSNLINNYNVVVGETQKVIDNIVDRCSNIMNVIQNNKETHWFSDTNYELSMRDGNMLINQANEVAGKYIDQLCSYFKESNEISTSEQDAYREHLESQDLVKSMAFHANKIKKMASEI